MKSKAEKAARRARIRKNFLAAMKAIFNWFKKAEKALVDILPKVMDITLKVMSFVKTGTDSSFADLITHWIPGDTDNILKEKVSIGLGKAIDRLGATRECILKATTVDEKINCFRELLSEHSEDAQLGLIRQLHAILVNEIIPEISLSEAGMHADKFHFSQKLVEESERVV